MKISVKALALTGILLLLGSVASQAQTVRIVNNKGNAPTGPNIYNNLQTAIDDADPGDILHVIASPIAYTHPSNVNTEILINKQLMIYGIGHDPDKDLPDESILYRVRINSGGSGTVLEGFKFVSWSSTGYLAFGSGTISNVSIRKCYFVNATYMTHDGSTTVQNLTFAYNVINRHNTTGIFFNNNSFGGNIFHNNIFQYTNIEVRNSTLRNNIFITSLQRQAFTNSNNNVVENNIFHRTTPASAGISNSVFNNNISFGAANNALPDIDGGGTQIFVGSNSGDNNIVGVDPEFISYPAGGAASWNKGYNFDVQGGSPAENAGTDGTDIGIFGGLEPYDRTVSLPFIKQLITPSAVKQGTDLSVTIQAEAN